MDTEFFKMPPKSATVRQREFSHADVAFPAFRTSSGPVEALSLSENIAAAQTLIRANHDLFAADGLYDVLKMRKDFTLLNGQFSGKIQRGPLPLLQKLDQLLPYGCRSFHINSECALIFLIPQQMPSPGTAYCKSVAAFIERIAGMSPDPLEIHMKLFGKLEKLLP